MIGVATGTADTPIISSSGLYLGLSPCFPERAEATVTMKMMSAATAIGTPTSAGTGEFSIVGSITPSPTTTALTTQVIFWREFKVCSSGLALTCLSDAGSDVRVRDACGREDAQQASSTSRSDARD